MTFKMKNCFIKFFSILTNAFVLFSNLIAKRINVSWRHQTKFQKEKYIHKYGLSMLLYVCGSSVLLCAMEKPTNSQITTIDEEKRKEELGERLIEAIKKGKSKKIKKVLKNGANANYESKSDRVPALFVAIACRNLKAVKKLLKYQADLTKRAKSGFFNAMLPHTVCGWGFALYIYGKTPFDRSFYTPLQAAQIVDHEDIVNILSDVKKESEDNDNSEVLESIVDVEQPENIEIVSDKQEDIRSNFINLIQKAMIIEDDVVKIEQLINVCPNLVNALDEDENGNHILFSCIEKCFSSPKQALLIIKMIVKNPMLDVNKPRYIKERYPAYSFLQYAVLVGDAECVQLLIQAGAELNFKGMLGWTAEEFAEKTNKEKIRSILEKERNMRSTKSFEQGSISEHIESPVSNDCGMAFRGNL